MTFTYGIEGVSRALLAQITRHRIGASFSVRSQRYCSEDSFGYVMPPSIAAHGKHSVRYKALMADIQNFYNKLVKLGVPKEDARMVLSNACETRMLLTMNLRELWHFLSFGAAHAHNGKFVRSRKRCFVSGKRLRPCCSGTLARLVKKDSVRRG